MKVSDLERYDQRITLRGYTGAVSVHMASTARAAGRIAALLFPTTTAEEHRRLAELHRKKADSFRARYAQEVDRVFLKNLGRKPRITDYKVTAVWLDTFPDEDKERLRSVCYPIAKHERIADAHAVAARRLAGARKRHLH